MSQICFGTHSTTTTFIDVLTGSRCCRNKTTLPEHEVYYWCIKHHGRLGLLCEPRSTSLLTKPQIAWGDWIKGGMKDRTINRRQGEKRKSDDRKQSEVTCREKRDDRWDHMRAVVLKVRLASSVTFFSFSNPSDFHVPEAPWPRPASGVLEQSSASEPARSAGKDVIESMWD